MPTKVAIVMPKTTAVPMTPRDAAPEPFASINGTQPRMNANEVIRIGRRRSLAPSSAASTIDLPSVVELGELYNQDSVFCRQGDEHHQTDLGVDIVVEVARYQPDEGPQHDKRRA